MSFRILCLDDEIMGCTVYFLAWVCAEQGACQSDRPFAICMENVMM